MHPAKSVIFFTTASGAGYGLIVWLSVSAILDLVPAERWFGFTGFAIGFSLIVGGLFSSMFHLGHPERFLRALSQWKSSWLSREGIAAIVSFIPMGLFALYWVFGQTHDGLAEPLAYASIVSALGTTYCTAMIYGSLNTIPAWSNRWTPPVYLALSLMTGAVLFALLVAVWRYASLSTFIFVTLFALSTGLLVKSTYWRSVSRHIPKSTSGTATGLKEFGQVQLVDAPHTESNYLLDEMGFQIARKHADKLRRYAVSFGFLVPIVLCVIALFVPGGILKTSTILFAAVSCGLGVVFERWLFFAEAKHVVTLYYGAKSV